MQQRDVPGRVTRGVDDAQPAGDVQQLTARELVGDLDGGEVPNRQALQQAPQPEGPVARRARPPRREGRGGDAVTPGASETIRTFGIPDRTGSARLEPTSGSMAP